MTEDSRGRGFVYLAALAIVLGLVGLVLSVLQSPWAGLFPAVGLVCVAAALALRGRP